MHLKGKQNVCLCTMANWKVMHFMREYPIVGGRRRSRHRIFCDAKVLFHRAIKPFISFTAVGKCSLGDLERAARIKLVSFSLDRFCI
jgi:hypothetical protein